MQNLLLCFVHGFKSSDSAFHDFPSDLQKLLHQSNSNLNVSVAIYPTYDTKGDLPQSVTKFRQWLQEKAVASETAENASEQTSVVLVAHSMGGLVAADAFLSILDEESMPPTFEPTKTSLKVLGILTFDTPFCGLSRSMFAYGAFAQYQTVSNAYSLATSLSSLALPSASNAAATSSAVSEASDNQPAWRLWQMIAIRTGAAGAVGAAGAAAYMNRERIGKGLSYLNKDSIQNGLSSMNIENVKAGMSMVTRENIEQGLSYMSRENLGNGFAWLSSHLRFVSHLMKREELQTRIDRLTSMEGIGFANLYTSLGENKFWSGGYFVAERTFCAIPAENTKSSKYFLREVNTKANDEIDAHRQLFESPKNSGYEEMSSHAKGLILSWAATHSGSVIDHYAISKEAKRQEEVALSTKEKGFTRYSYNADSGFKEVTAESKEAAKDRRWLDGLSTPRYIELKKYIPSVGGKQKNDEKTTEEGVSKFARYYYGGSGFREDGQEASKVDPTPDNASTDTDYKDAVSQHGDATEEDEPEDDELLRIDTDHIPGVTEDLRFDDLPKENTNTKSDSVEQPKESLVSDNDGPTHEAKGTKGETDVDDTSAKPDSPDSGTEYESFPSVETPSYETFAPLRSNPTVSKKRPAILHNPSSKGETPVITKDFAPKDAKARLEHTLSLDPSTARKTAPPEQLHTNGSINKDGSVNGAYSSVDAQRPGPGKRRGSSWYRWKRSKSQKQKPIVLQEPADERTVDITEEKGTVVQESDAAPWQWRPWKWRWRRPSGLNVATA